MISHHLAKLMIRYFKQFSLIGMGLLLTKELLVQLKLLVVWCQNLRQSHQRCAVFSCKERNLFTRILVAFSQIFPQTMRNWNEGGYLVGRLSLLNFFRIIFMQIHCFSMQIFLITMLQTFVCIITTISLWWVKMLHNSITVVFAKRRSVRCHWK